jgi:hypothetical protein
VSGREYNVVIRPRRGGAPDRKRVWFALVFAPVAVLGIARSFHHSVTSGLWYAAGALTLTAFTVMARANFFARTSIAVSASFVRRTGYVGRSAGWTRGRSSCASGTALGVDWDEQAKVRTFAQLRREVPGSFPWSLAHVWLTLAIVAVLGLVIGTAISASSRAS